MNETDLLEEHQCRVFLFLCHVSELGNKTSLGQTIEFLHSVKLIQTDLKSENVLLTSWDEQEVKLYSGDDIKVPAAPHIKGDKIYDYSKVIYMRTKGGNIHNDITRSSSWSPWRAALCCGSHGFSL